MSEKLDLFEMTIKRGLEHYELPLDPNAWNEFEQVLDKSRTPMAAPVGGGAGILPKFGIAAAFLLGSLFFVNQSVEEHSTDSAETSTHITEGTSLQNAGDSMDNSEHMIAQDSSSNISGESDSSTHGSSDAEVTSSDRLAESSIDGDGTYTLSETERSAIERINNRLQEKADEKASGSDLDEEKKRYTTRYVGKDFNLGAVKSFSPNNDGKNDSFLPASLEKGDLFKMTISDEGGKVIFTSADVANPWNGSDSLGNELQEGRYAWEVILQKDKKKEIFKGTVLLER